MKIKFLLLHFLACFPAIALGQHLPNIMPFIDRQSKPAQLIVDQKPFQILGGELGNSSASDINYMKPYWPKFISLHLNTVLFPVYWELMEPREGTYDFKLVDQMIAGCRQHHLKAVVLWFGSWKNSMSCYAPLWVKNNSKRFPRAVDHQGKTSEILTPFEENNLNADRRAFVALMKHLKETDGSAHTVLMVQVENEIGMLPDARDYYHKATNAFDGQVPTTLSAYLQTHHKTLPLEVLSRWQANGLKNKGSWTELFGKGENTEELFMAWHFGRYVQEIILAGKKAYPLPMYVNAALNRPGKKPGEYPSAGPLPHVLDIWKAAAPAIDIFSPDVYFPEMKNWADLYTRGSDPLFIPETGSGPGSDAKAFYIFGHYGAIGFSPFSIESIAKPEESPIARAYDVIAQLGPLRLSKQGSGQVEGVLLNQKGDSSVVSMGDYMLTVKHDLSWGRSGLDTNASPPQTGGIIINVAKDEFYIGGTGIIVTFKPSAYGNVAGIGYIDEGRFLNGKWLRSRRLNGDQDHQGRHLRIPLNSYGIQHIKLYSY